jgi:hypothetical protein
VDNELQLIGWAVSPERIAKVVLLCNSELLAEAKYPMPRPDVFKIFPEYRDDNAGFDFRTKLPSELEGSEFQVAVYSDDKKILARRSFRIAQ